MNESSKTRLATIDARFGARIRAADGTPHLGHDAFVREFQRVRDAIIIPIFRDVGSEIAKMGARFDIEVDDRPAEGREAPSVTLRLFLTSRAASGHRIAFTVIDRDPHKGLEVLAFLEASPPPMDLARFQPGEITTEIVERLVVDAIEQIYACAAEL